MQVTFPSHHRWLKEISDGDTLGFSGRTAKKIKTAFPLLEANSITYTIEPLNEAFFGDFMPLYTEYIGGKKNALLYNVAEKTLHNKTSEFPYFCLSLRENGVFLGGTIFSLRKDRGSYAYRTFMNQWIEAPLKASPALIGEYLVAKFAFDHGLRYISHGRDRNPYGLNAGIGLAIFKLSVGCKADVGRDYEVSTLETESLTEDCLILELPSSGTDIAKAYLVTLPENEFKYIQATKYPELLNVTVLYRGT